MSQRSSLIVCLAAISVLLMPWILNGPGLARSVQEPTEVATEVATETLTATATITLTKTPIPTVEEPTGTPTPVCELELAYTQATATLQAYLLEHCQAERWMCWQNFEHCVRARTTSDPALETAEAQLTAAAHALGTAIADQWYWYEISWQCIHERATVTAKETGEPCLMRLRGRVIFPLLLSRF